ncbi:hypothetical protein AYO38_07085 [bacterium SCGC AG-212-C10]|nr:hypothetical protein AYO38_07085 [bacterium SCGC AG-212-C10]
MSDFVGRMTLVRLREVAILIAVLLLPLYAALPLVTRLASAADSSAAPLAVPLSNSFTYQGKLTQASADASGPFDFQFFLFDAAAGGAQVGATITTPAVAVTNGLFAVQLNFGDAAFSGDTRWLEVRVKASAAASYESLGRQQLTATPYALYARAAAVATTASVATVAQSVPWSGITGVPAEIADGDQTGPTYTAQSPVALVGNAFGFSTVGCTAGEVWKYSGPGNTWSCDADASGTSYSAGEGLTLSGSQFAVAFGSNGVAATASRSDHNHLGRILVWKPRDGGTGCCEHKWGRH